MEIFERLKEFRKSLHLNQSEFADPLGVIQATYSSYESGNRPIPDRFIKSVCSIYHISEDWLRTGNGDMIEQESLGDILDGIFSAKLPEMLDAERKSFVSALVTLDEERWKILLDAVRVLAEISEKNRQ